MPSPPYVLSVYGPDLLSNWDSFGHGRLPRQARALAGRDRALSRSLYPGLAGGVVASSFNTALSVRQYLNAPDGAVYGFAPTPPRSIGQTVERSPRTAVAGLYLASAYAGFGGYTGVVQAGGACADMILREG